MFKAIGTYFKSLKKQEAPEEITSPTQLSKGDMLRFADSFSLPEGLRGETFQVQKVATYFYTDEPTSQFVIKSGSNKPLFLSIEDFDGEEQVVISRKLKNKEVESLVGWDAIRAAMKNENNRDITINESSSDSWLADSYSRRVFGAKGHYFEKDHRNSSSLPAGGEHFSYYEFYTPDESKSLEIEAWDGDEIEVCVGLVRPMSDINEFWKRS